MEKENKFSEFCSCKFANHDLRILEFLSLEIYNFKFFPEILQLHLFFFTLQWPEYAAVPNGDVQVV